MDEQKQQNEVKEEPFDTAHDRQQEEQNIQVESTPLSEPPSHKNLIIGIIVGFVLVVVAGLYFNSNKQSSIEDVVNAPSEKVVTETPTEKTDNTLISEETSDLEVETVITTTEPSLTDTKEDSALLNEIVVNEPEFEVEVIISHTEYPEWVGTAMGIIKEMEDVFVGRIVKKIGDSPIHGTPATAYTVEVLERIAGNATGNVTLLQGGVGYFGDKLAVTQGDIGGFASDLSVKPNDIFFKSGAVYIFSTEYWPKGNAYVISLAPYDRELITTDITLSDAAAIDLAKENSKVQEFVEAARKLGVLSEGW